MTKNGSNYITLNKYLYNLVQREWNMMPYLHSECLWTGNA